MSSNLFRGNNISADASSANVTRERFVVLDNTGSDKTCDRAGAAANVIGIAGDTVAQGEDVAIFTDGPGSLEVDGSGTAIAVGDRLASNASGIGVVATVGQFFGARALQPSSAAGDKIEVVIENGQLN